MSVQFDPERYRRWIADFEPDAEACVAFGRTVSVLAIQPSFGVLVLGEAGPEHAVTDRAALLHSLEAQVYAKWRVLDHDSPRGNGGIETRLAVTPEDYIVVLPPDATLSPIALAEFVAAINEHPDHDVFFADEDRLTEGVRSDPEFKSFFDPIHAIAHDTLGTPVVVRRGLLLDLLAAHTIEMENAEGFLYEIALCLITDGLASRVLHVPAVLAHRRREGDWDASGGRTALIRHLQLDERAVTTCSGYPQWLRILHSLPSPPPRVSIIVPTRDQPEYLARTLSGLLDVTRYDNLELVLVDNGTRDERALAAMRGVAADSRVKILRDERPFNYSRLNNLGASVATGSVFVLLNNDMDIVDSDWLRLLVAHLAQPDVGIVGAMLLYPDGRIQHAGIAFGADTTIEHRYRFAADGGAETAASRCVPAVTGACLAIAADLYRSLDGLDEESFPVAYNDVDLCLRVRALGLRVVLAADVRLIHHESVTRGAVVSLESEAREDIEVHRFWSKHPTAYFGRDLIASPNVVHRYDTTELASPPRRDRPWLHAMPRDTAAFLY